MDGSALAVGGDGLSISFFLSLHPSYRAGPRQSNAAGTYSVVSQNRNNTSTKPGGGGQLAKREGGRTHIVLGGCVLWVRAAIRQCTHTLFPPTTAVYTQARYQAPR